MNISPGGTYTSEETLRKQVECKIGDKNPMFGKTINPSHKKRMEEGMRKSEKFHASRKSPEYREKISKIQRQDVFLLDENREIKMIFKNMTDIAILFDVSYGNIKNARRFKRPIGKSLFKKFYVVYAKDFKTS